MPKIQDPANKIDLPQYLSLFAQCFSTIENEDLYVIVGHHNSGKSLFIDLLSGKELTQYEDPELQNKILVEKNNFQHQYHPLYIKKTNQQICIESFTLSTDEQKPPSSRQNLKLIFLQQLLKICKKVAFIILIQQSWKQNIVKFFEDFLSNIGITQSKKHQNIDSVKQLIYLLFTKTEEHQFQEANSILNDLSGQAQNENVKEIFKYLVEKNAVAQFRNKAPDPNYLDQIKNKFKAKQFKGKIFETLNKSPLILERPFHEADQRQAMTFLQQMSKLITSLILFANTEDKSHQRQYENMAKKLYPDNKKVSQISSMTGKWNKSSLQKIADISKLSSLSKTQDILKKYLDCLLQVLKTLEQANEDKLIFKQMQAKIILVAALSWWFQSNIVDNAKEIVNHFLGSIKILRQSQKPKVQTKPKPVPKGNNKKKNAFDIFKQELQQCKSNGQAIQFCLSKIKKKEQEEKYDYFQVIFYIKLLRDMLEEFISPQSLENNLFIKQLLQLSFYTEDYFDFQNYLKIALGNKLLSINLAKYYMQALYNANKFQYCEKIVDYLLASIPDSEQYSKLIQLKDNLKIKVIEQFKNRQMQKPKNEIKKKKISFQYSILAKKAEEVMSFRQYLQGQDFQRHLASKE